MIILIAESKTMAPELRSVTDSVYQEHRPVYEEIADNVMLSLENDSVDEISRSIKISVRMARDVKRMIYEFSNKSAGLPAIESYTGVVFRQLHVNEYTHGQKAFMIKNVRIISSLYGWLRPDDIIKTYRFDFDTKLAPGGISFKKFWKKDVTIALVKMIEASGEKEILNLLPADASACIDWKLVKRFADMIKVEFKEPTGPDTMKTPNAGRLKELRGRLLDQIIKEGITDSRQLQSLSSPHYDGLGELTHPGYFYFLTT